MNLKRKHYTEAQKVLMGQVIEELEKEKAKERMSKGGSHPKKEEAKGGSIDTPLLDEGEKGRAADRVFGSSKENSSSSFELKLLPEKKGQARDRPAREVGLPPTTYQRGKVIMERGTEEIKKRYLTDKYRHLGPKTVQFAEYCKKGCSRNPI